MALSFTQAIDTVSQRSGIVLPIYLPEALASGAHRALIEETARNCRRVLADGARLCLSVDGAPFGAELAGRLAAELGAGVQVSPQNRGKLNAARLGARHLLRRADVDYVAVIDQDGDHFPNELVNFVAAAQHAAAGRPGAPILVLGRRLSRHRPMGFLRGEMEELADRVLLDALHYRAAVRGRPLGLEYATLFDEFPDFHSGYKLFSRRCAEDVFGPEPRLAGLPEDASCRHGCEAVMVVEALEAGAVLAVVNRTTINEQPLSTFGLLKRSRLVADKILWPCRRLEIPAPFVLQWVDNHLPRLLLTTLAPAGREELMQIRELVCAGLGAPAPAAAAPLRQPAFL